MPSDEQPPLTDEQRRAVETWNNVGAAGPPPQTPFLTDERLRERLKEMVRPREVPVAWRFSADDTARLRGGHHSNSMDDKWNIWCDGEVVHFHRSWTGHEIFRVRLVDDMVSALLVETDPERHRATEDDGEILRRFSQVLQFVLSVTPQPS